MVNPHAMEERVRLEDHLVKPLIFKAVGKSPEKIRNPGTLRTQEN